MGNNLSIQTFCNFYCILACWKYLKNRCYSKFIFSRELAFFGVEEDKPIRNGNKTLTFLALLRTYLGVDNFHFKSALTTLPKFFIFETKNISTFYFTTDNVKRAYLGLNPSIFNDFLESETLHFLWFWSYLQHQYILCILKRIL